jgi:acyl-CoA synthetase (NDP forming)
MKLALYAKKEPYNMSWDTGFESAFNPKVVAIVGISAKARLTSPGGSRYLDTYQQMGFPGKIYLVNASATEILGKKAYPSVSAIPEPVDLVIVTAPSKAIPGILEDCYTAHARNIHIFTAGFEETGLAEEKELGKQVREIALRRGLRLLGPNCMGLYVPESHIAYIHKAPVQSGPVSFVFQSGGHSEWMAQHGQNYGVYFNKGISYGNGYVLDSTDFLEYLAADPQTGIICMYLEGVRDGRRLLDLLRQTVPQKPVIIWKGGMTAAGSHATASHTGSLAGSTAIWQALFAQTGAVQVSSLEEMAETAMTFLCVKPPQGKRVAVLGMGGGISVYAADACGREKLEVPALSPATRAELNKFIPEAGASTRNPIDCGSVFVDVSLLIKEMQLVAADPSIDMLILMPHLNLARNMGPEQVEKMVGYMTDFALNNPYHKPAVIVFHTFINETWENELIAKLRVELPRKGVAVYNTLSGAARALVKIYEFNRFRQERGYTGR